MIFESLHVLDRLHSLEAQIIETLDRSYEKPDPMIVSDFLLILRKYGIPCSSISIFWNDDRLRQIMGVERTVIGISEERIKWAAENIIEHLGEEIYIIDIIRETSALPLWLKPPKEKAEQDKLPFLFGLFAEKKGKFFNANILRKITFDTYSVDINEGNVFYFPSYYRDRIFFDAVFSFEIAPEGWELLFIERLCTAFINSLHLACRIYINRLYALRSAIAAIMSRNMSHNLGSHVLSRIATKEIEDLTEPKTVNEEKNWIKDLVHWSKDAQYLGRYMQQRMDFIAQISTEWPQWTEPAYLLKDLLRWFLFQKHLLNFIARSENLGAHLLLPEGTSPMQEDDLKGDIRFHVFMLPVELWKKSHFQKNDFDEAFGSRFRDIYINCRTTESPLNCRKPEAERENCHLCHRILFHTPETGDAIVNDTEDILLTIPGGIVGYHGFYVILENVIRNAAKHGYAKISSKTDCLHVIVEILYDPEEKIAVKDKDEKKVPAYLVRVYDTVSSIQSSKANNNGVSLWGDTPRGINPRLLTSIITETGELRKEDWGLAEMKIAAGYLQQRSITHIGGKEDQITGREKEIDQEDETDQTMLKTGKSNEGAEAIIRAIESPIGTLGYEFFIPRPRSIGIVCKESGN